MALEEIDLYRIPSEKIATLDQSLLNAPVYFFVNPVEYHGPHLSLYNDYVLSLGLAKKLHQKMFPHLPFIIGPTIHLGVDPARGPGGQKTSYLELKSILIKSCKSLVKLPVKKVVFMTFHGSPLHSIAIHKAMQFLKRHGILAVNPLYDVVTELIHYDEERYQITKQFLASKHPNENIDHIIKYMNNDFHAGMFETSLALYLAKETVGDYKKVPDCPPIKLGPLPHLLSKIFSFLGNQKISNEMKFGAYAEGWVKLSPSLGYTGWPRLSDYELGLHYVEDHILPKYQKRIHETFNGQAEIPKPHMNWLEWVSLKGLILGS